jgi:hypothetical protein
MQTNFNDLEIGLIITGIILFLVGILLWRLFVRSKNRNQELSEELTLLGAAKALDEKEINKLTNLMDAHQLKLDNILMSKIRSEKEVDELKTHIKGLNSRLGKKGAGYHGND